MRRFYKTVSVRAEEAGHAVLLDGRPLRSPAKRGLRLPTPALAEAVADEWRAQGEKVDAASMPMMAFAATAIDRVAPQRQRVVAEIAAFGGNDLLCYRAESPESLVAAQDREWQPLLDWAAGSLGARLSVTAGLMPVDQDLSALTTLRSHVEVHSDWELVPLHAVTTITGSLILGLAVLRVEIDADRAFALGQLEEMHQAERWGMDREAEQRRRRLRTDLADANKFLSLVRA